ncbi:MAG TPA: glycosyltransferase family 1 protein, partial [Cellulomonadaceae bacterium]|nr:glycosyltransferase family 1 protein [Cellulomonadaceae bacterium]
MTVEQCWQRVPGGSASYVVALLDALHRRPDVTMVGLSDRHTGPPMPDYAPRGPVRSLGLPRGVLYRSWNWLSAPRPEWTERDLDVVHAATWAIPPTGRPLVVTIHDVAFLRDPSHFTPRGVRFFTRALSRARNEADVVIVPSRATAGDCVEAGIDAARIHVVPHGAPHWIVRADEIASVRSRLRLPQRFILWCGTYEPRKNLTGLLAAFALAFEEDPALHLVLVGPPGWGARPESATTAAWSSHVHHVGRLSTSDLRVVYAAATAFCFPSIWEGFGLPVLEAMAVGTPVVTSRGTSMAEVVGDAGVLAAPDDPAEIAAGMLR